MVSPPRPTGIGDHDFGGASADDGREGRGPGVAPSVGDDDRRAAQLVARGEVSHLRAFEHGAPALVELAGHPSRDRRLVRVGLQLVDGLGRLGGRGLVGLLVGELVLEGLVDQAAQPRGDVDGFLPAESVEPAPHLGVDPEADGGLWRHAGILRDRSYTHLRVDHVDTHRDTRSQFTQCATFGLAMGLLRSPFELPSKSPCRAVALLRRALTKQYAHISADYKALAALLKQERTG